VNLLVPIETSDSPIGIRMAQGSARTIIERDVLPAYLARTRWYPEHSAEVIRPTLISAIPLGDAGDNVPWLAFFETTQFGATARFVLPMQIVWERAGANGNDLTTLAAVREGTRKGLLLDVATDRVFIDLLLRNLRESLTVEKNGKRLEFRPTPQFSKDLSKQPQNIRAVQTEQSNSTALVDHDYVVKIYRKLEPGINPEVEMGRFMTEVAGFANTPALLGSVELAIGDTRSAIAIVHRFIQNQGDAWSFTSTFLDRFAESQHPLAAQTYPCKRKELLAYLRYMEQIGRRLAEMHIALAGSEGTDFAPESIQPSDIRLWHEENAARADRVFEAIDRRRFAFPEEDRSLAEKVLAHRGLLFDRLNILLPSDSKGLKIRHHGDLHLGQILIVPNDIFIIDFEGEPRRSIDQRRRKAPPARDVAGIIRSIDYSRTAALQRALKRAPDRDGSVCAGLTEWRYRATAAFLIAYSGVMTTTHLWPSDARAAEQMLRFFLLEKVLYEIEYELAHRPDWLRVPLTGMLELLFNRPIEAS
jgi:maltose alpha-D-glucosyltransferase / alpha-amylase